MNFLQVIKCNLRCRASQLIVYNTVSYPFPPTSPRKFERICRAGELRDERVERHRERLNLRQTTDLQSERGAKKFLSVKSFKKERTIPSNMTQQVLEEFLKEHQATIGAQLGADFKNGLWVSGVFGKGEGEFWLVVSHQPTYNGERYITHMKKCDGVHSIFDESEGIVSDMGANPQKYKVRA